MQVYVGIEGNFSPTTVYKLEITDVSGDFTTPIFSIDTIMAQTGPIQFRTPKTLEANKFYKMRVVTSNQVVSQNIMTLAMGQFTALTTEFHDGVLTSSASTGNQWYLNDMPIPGEVGQTIDINRGGAYAASIYENGCTVLSEPFLITSTGESLASVEFGIFPVPAQNEVTIDNPSKTDVPYYFMDMNGREMKQGQLKAGRNTLGLSTLPSGFYLIRIYHNNKMLVRKFVKK
jgi:hypothetical protein